MAYVQVKGIEAAPEESEVGNAAALRLAAAVAPTLVLPTLTSETAPADLSINDAPEHFARALNLIAARDFKAAAAELDPVFLPAGSDIAFQIAWAEALIDARAPELSDQVFERLLAAYPGNREIHVAYAKRLHVRGLLLRAHAVLHAVADTLPQDSRSLQLYRRLVRLMAIFKAADGGPLDEDEDARMRALRLAIAAFENRPVRDLPKDRLGRISLITGSLGPGGAERQLTRTAAELEKRRRATGKVGDFAIDRPVEVVVRSHQPNGQHDFFLEDLRSAEVDLFEINTMPQARVTELGVDDKTLLALLDFLPPKVNFGTRRLVQHFRQSQPDVVSIWQDGACLFAGLAAVLAGVPRIQLVIRGLPPVIRRHMFQPEYEVMYRALAAVPGVEFISNSKAAARAYAEWLDLPLERFAIVYNGVQRMASASSEDLDTQWQDFLAATPDADHTVGGVFRFDTDKRPLLWIRFAARYAKAHPKARFLLVGGGRLLDDAIALAESLGVRDRILFVGRSTEVGYWMKHMDVLVLMSSFEGLPNVLIEAQFLGVPVVSTPAGGAAECFIEGVTGHILGSADKTDLDEACTKVRALVGRAHDPEIFEPATRDFLDAKFSVPRMLENFVSTSCGIFTESAAS
ncbi:MAG: glycosyltransferase [Novosphingobium sp.]|uniref:glycosyltransferase n=1 Tax=Novosphingobium sp. TaxID=1874826 RepID=UPI0030186B4C